MDNIQSYIQAFLFIPIKTQFSPSARKLLLKKTNIHYIILFLKAQSLYWMLKLFATDCLPFAASDLESIVLVGMREMSMPSFVW